MTVIGVYGCELIGGLSQLPLRRVWTLILSTIDILFAQPTTHQSEPTFSSETKLALVSFNVETASADGRVGFLVALA